MSPGIIIVLVFLASILAVPAVLRLYVQRVRRRYGEHAKERAPSLKWAARAERFWFQVSPFLLLAAGAIAVVLAWRAK